MFQIDQRAFQRILSPADASGEVIHSLIRVTEFQSDTMPRAGLKQQAADTLSRLPNDKETTTYLNEALWYSGNAMWVEWKRPKEMMKNST